MENSLLLAKLKAAYSAWNDTRGDVSVWEELLAEDVSVFSIDEAAPGLSFARDRKSKADALAYLSALTQDWTMVHYTPRKFVEQGDDIAMFGSCAFRHKGTGKVAECLIACLWRFRDGLAIELTEVFDSAKAVRAAE